MNDIFNRTTDVFGGSFSADQGFVTFPQLRDFANTPLGADVGLLIQQLALQYQQQVTRLYEVGRPAVYLVGGRTSGNAGINRVVGPRSITTAFYSTYGDICRARENTLNFSLQIGCGFEGEQQQATVSYTAHFCVIVAVGVNVASAQMLINESLQIIFSSLLYSTANE